MDGDRKQWDDAWRRMIHRRLLDTSLFDFSAALRLDLGDLVTVTINECPAEYADTLYIENQICPICGTDTYNGERVTISVNPVFTKNSNLAFGAKAHRTCFEKCPIIDEPIPVPW